MSVPELRDFLIETAGHGNCVTYAEVAERFGYNLKTQAGRNALSDDLGRISYGEHEAGRPMLSAVVVRAQGGFPTGAPGQGFFNLATEIGAQELGVDDVTFFSAELQRVYEQWQDG